MTFHGSRHIAGIPHTDVLSAPAVEEGGGEAGPKPVQSASYTGYSLWDLMLRILLTVRPE